MELPEYNVKRYLYVDSFYKSYITHIHLWTEKTFGHHRSFAFKTIVLLKKLIQLNKSTEMIIRIS